VNRERHLDRTPAVLEHDRLGQGRAAARERFQQLEPQHVLGVAQPDHRPALGRARRLDPQHARRAVRLISQCLRAAVDDLGVVVELFGINPQTHRHDAGDHC